MSPLYAGDEMYPDDVTSGVFDDDFEEERCAFCDGPMENSHDTTVCDECSGLAHCVDDICYGQGWCMHSGGLHQ